MLSHQAPNSLQGRHQRQNSTPAVFNIQNTLLPATPRHNEPHQRGLSLDQPGHTQQNHGLPQQDGNFFNVEYQIRQQLTQANMRVAQQQPMARPGLDQETVYETIQKLKQGRTLTTEQAVPRQERGIGTYNNNYHTTPTTDINNNTKQSLQNAYENNTMDMFQPFDSTNSAGYLDGFGPGLDEYKGNTQPNETTNKQSVTYSMLSVESPQPPTGNILQPPCTPPSQTRTSYFPLTPATTPLIRNANIKKAPQSRTANSSPTRRDPSLTIKASHRMQRGNSCQDNFAAMRQHAMTPDIPSPPNTAPLEPRRSVDLAAFPQPELFNMSSLRMDIPLWNDRYNASDYSPMSNAVSSAISSFQSSPEVTHMPLLEDQDGPLMALNLSTLPVSQSAMDLGSYDTPTKHDSQPRSQSVSEIDDLNDCVEDTGVTCDEIASFISHADADNRWTCLYPDCGKKFGRKENIKSHVQTHLDDRQFRCKDCNKRFVRQHDLKRHANIHSGVRSYPCACGKPFARHDALTRHRQRGMCIGAFEGTPKKVIKRGRPKKARPDAEERLEKSAATRQRALENLEKRSPGKYASSVSGSSVCSYPSPEQVFDDMDFAASSPCRGFESLQQISNNGNEIPFGYTPAGSPGNSTGDQYSPHPSLHSHTSKAASMSPSPHITAIPEEPLELPESQEESRRNSCSEFGTPPELDISSSSPAASKFFDFEGSSDANSSVSLPMSFEPNKDLFGMDIDLSAELSRTEAQKDVNSTMFHDFFDSELEGTEFAPLPSTAYENAFNDDDGWADEFMSII